MVVSYLHFRFLFKWSVLSPDTQQQTPPFIVGPRGHFVPWIPAIYSSGLAIVGYTLKVCEYIHSQTPIGNTVFG